MIHIILFLLTFASTFFVGGILYSVSIMSILFAHEMGHYLMSRKYGVPATMPYFIPFPFSPFGTFGAIIKMKGIIINKKALFDIGVGGPLAGFIVSLPFIFIGIKLSSVELIAKDARFLQLGDPLLFKMLQWVLIGEMPEGYDLVLHPFGYAGWVGLFVTALNLLPVGQLDGGHIIYALFGEKSKKIYIAVVLVMAVFAVFYNPSWIGWVILAILLLIFGMKHPQTVDTETGLDPKRRFIAFIVLIIFILSFTPTPFPSVNLGRERDMKPDVRQVVANF